MDVVGWKCNDVHISAWCICRGMEMINVHFREVYVVLWCGIVVKLILQWHMSWLAILFRSFLCIQSKLVYSQDVKQFVLHQFGEYCHSNIHGKVFTCSNCQ